MPDNDQNWITTRIIEARKESPLVTEAALTEMSRLLSENLSQKTLSPKELTQVAGLLIARMVPDTSNDEAKE